jgi:hypothetical protein
MDPNGEPRGHRRLARTQSMWLQSTEIRVRTGACGYFRVPHGRPGRTRVKCERSQVDTGREPRGESDVRDGRHTCDRCGERFMRERPQMHVHREGDSRERPLMHVHRESDSRERPQMHTERRVVSVGGARECKYIHGDGHACGKTCVSSVVSTGPVVVRLTAEMAIERERELELDLLLYGV